MNTKKILEGLIINTPITAYVKACPTNDMVGGPSWASFVVDQNRIDEFQRLQSLVVAHNLYGVQVWDSPTWESQTEYRISTVTLSVTDDSFYFVGFPKNSSFSVETDMIAFADFEAVLRKAIEVQETTVYFSLEDDQIEQIRESLTRILSTYGNSFCEEC